MTSLYDDPANAFIELTEMVYLANNKLKGEDILESLRYKRKQAVEVNDWLEKMNIEKK